MPISDAYGFLTKTFAAHERGEIESGLKSAGKTISKAEGKKLGPSADTFADFYANHKAPGKSVTREAFTAFAGARFEAQMKALEASLAKGPGVDGFKLAKDVADNWQSFVGKQELFKYAELPAQHKAIILENAHWQHSQIPEPPATASVTRSSITSLPPAIAAYVAAQEAKHFVSEDPAVQPPLASDIFQVKLHSVSDVKCDGVTVGYAVRFANAGTVCLDVEGGLVTGKGLGLFEVSPSSAVGFGALSAEQKIEKMMNEELTSVPAWENKTMSQVLSGIGSTMSAAAIKKEFDAGQEYLANSLDEDMYHAAGISLHAMGVYITPALLSQVGDYQGLVDHIVAKAKTAHGQETADEVADALGNGGADVSGPQIQVFEENGQIVGASFRWSASVDGDHDYWQQAFYDHTSKTFIGGASGGYETDTDVWVN